MDEYEKLQYQRGSLRGLNLTEEEELFLQKVEEGEISDVISILKRKPKVLNAVDFRGVSALHFALTNNDDDMIDLLITNDRYDVRDCVLHAIKLNRPEFVRLILKKFEEYERKHNLEKATILSLPCVKSSAFPDYMTPLMLAAQCGSIELVDLLLCSGHPHILEPHRPGCLCEDCVTALKNDPLKMTYKTYETFKAFCNPAYICKREEDPILEAFNIVKKLKKTAERNRVFLSKYREIIQQTERFTADFVALCRNTKEVKIILTAKKGIVLNQDFRYPRLLLAIHYKQRYFVTQRNVQLVLLSDWLGDWYAWRGYSRVRRFLHLLGRIFMLPIFYITYTFFPDSRLADLYLIPLNRMISSVASYAFFLLLCLFGSIRDKRNQTRYDIQYQMAWQFLIFLYWISHFTHLVRKFIIQGAVRFLSFRWNLYDLAMVIIFFMTLAFWLVAHLTMYSEPDIERKYWHYLDPQLLAEGLFSIGTVMAYMRLLYVLQTNSAVGPLQVSLGRMINDVLQFSVIFIIVMVSFTVGMSHMNEYYYEMKQMDPDTKSESVQDSSFTDITNTLKALFWALFYMTPDDASKVVIENLPSVGGRSEYINTHDLTEAVGYTMYIVYLVLTTVFLTNMLIAAMGNRFTEIIDNVDIEWAYSRSEVFLNYMSDYIFPSPISVILQQIFRKSNTKNTNLYVPLPRYEEDENEEEQYTELIKLLIQRYFKQDEDFQQKIVDL